MPVRRLAKKIAIPQPDASLVCRAQESANLAPIDRRGVNPADSPNKPHFATELA